MCYSMDKSTSTQILFWRREEKYLRRQLDILLKIKKFYPTGNSCLRIKKLIENLEDCESYISNVGSGKVQGDPEIGRALNKCLSQFTSEDM